MKTKDQKQLEFLYEQISQPFILLKLEKNYFDTVANELADHIISKKKNLLVYVDMEEDCDKKTLANFDRLLWIETLPVFIDNDDRKSWAINETYKESIISKVTTLIHINKKINASNTSALTLEFRKINTPEKKEESVIGVDNKSSLKEELQKALCESLEYFYMNFNFNKTVSHEQHTWYEWRKKESSYESFRNKFPELEGIF